MGIIKTQSFNDDAKNVIWMIDFHFSLWYIRAQTDSDNLGLGSELLFLPSLDSLQT